MRLKDTGPFSGTRGSRLMCCFFVCFLVSVCLFVCFFLTPSGRHQELSLSSGEKSTDEGGGKNHNLPKRKQLPLDLQLEGFALVSSRGSFEKKLSNSVVGRGSAELSGKL